MFTVVNFLAAIFPWAHWAYPVKITTFHGELNITIEQNGTEPSQAEPKVIEHVPTERPAKARGSLLHMGLDKTRDKRVRITQMQKAKIVEYSVKNPSNKYQDVLE
jgi:hypothetical protein